MIDNRDILLAVVFTELFIILAGYLESTAYDVVFISLLLVLPVQLVILFIGKHAFTKAIKKYDPEVYSLMVRE